MKKVIFATAILSLTATLASVAQADTVRLVTGDNSDLSKQCIAAVQTGQVELSPLERREVLCNGMPLDRFAKVMRHTLEELQTTYKFSKSDESALTQLCLAAVESEETYLAAKQELFGNTAGLEESVLCNNMPIDEFARKYRNRAVTASL